MRCLIDCSWLRLHICMLHVELLYPPMCSPLAWQVFETVVVKCFSHSHSLSLQQTEGHLPTPAPAPGVEKRERTETAAKRPLSATLGVPNANPYIDKFVRSMSQEPPETGGQANGSNKPTAGDGDGPTKPSSSSSKPPTAHGDEGSTEGVPVKRRRLGETCGKGYRRAYRSPSPHVQAVQKDLEAMKISPQAVGNPYVDHLDRTLQVCLVPNTSCSCSTLSDEEGDEYLLLPPFHNQYIVGYHQRLLKRNRVCQASRPNCYVAQLHRW